MQKTKKLIYVVFIVLLILGQVTLAFSKCNRVLKNGWMNNWEPYVFGTPDKPSGLDTEILDAIVTGAGCKLVFTQNEFPWARHLAMVRNGKLDFANAAQKTKEREEYAYFIGPYRAEYYGIFIRKGEASKFSLTKAEDLTKINFKIGAIIGYNYGEKLNSIFEKMKYSVQRVPEKKGDINLMNRHKLLANRIDGYLASTVDEILLLKKSK